MKELITKQWTIVNDVKKIKEKTESEQWGTVYAIEYGEHLKIGFTKDLIKRVKTFIRQSRYNPIKINKIAFTPFHSNFNENEKALHEFFKQFRIKGTELFSISLNEFLEKVPALPLDKIIVDYKNEIKDLVAGQQRKIISSKDTQIQVYEDINLPVREYKGERVVTFEDIDFIHERPTGTAGRNFRKNKERFCEGVDYFNAKQSDFLMDEIRPLEIPNRGLTLITKMGYQMLVKSFTDDKAWMIQRLLVVNYFESQSNKEEELGTVIINLIENKDNINMEQINNMITGTKTKFANVGNVALDVPPNYTQHLRYNADDRGGRPYTYGQMFSAVYSNTKQKEDETKGINMDLKKEDSKNKFYCNVDNIFYKTKSQAKKETGAIVNRMKTSNQIMELTPLRLSNAVKQGYSFTAAVLKGTKEEDFISQWLAIVDIDNDRKDIPVMTVEEAINILETHGIAYSFIYYSFSHSTTLPKFRIVCILSKYITAPEQAKKLNQYLISLFPQADQSCHNLDRFYYGTDKGLATEVFDRTTDIIIPEDLKDKSDDAHLNAEPKKLEFKHKTKSAYDFNLADAIKTFDLLSYVEHTTSIQGRKRGKDFLFNPCPVCGHQDDFYIDVEKNVYKCHSASNGTGGNIINYLEQTLKLDRKAAREYFIYDIMKQDRKAQKQAYKAKKQYNAIKDKAPKNKKLIDKLIELQPHDNYYWNDLGSSRLFAEIYRDYFRYNYTAKEWYIFDGKKWVEDTGSAKTLRQFEKLYDALLNYATTIEDMNKKRDYFEYILKLGKASERTRILEDAENICAVFRDDFDKNNDLFNCQNGTLNLKTFEFKPHNSANLLTKISNVYYEPNAESHEFKKFIDEIMQGNAEKTEYLQKALGYGLTTDTHYETCFILYGATTRNGKSTLMSAIMYVLGEHGGYALDMKPETLALKKNLDSRQASGDIARLDGCRFLNASEPPKRMIFDVALLKNLLGRDPITARNIYEREFTFRPKFKLFINTNFLPLITDDTLFKSGRINVITFDRHFTPQEQDKTLKDRLMTQENISGIFNWILEGLKKFRKDGLEPPKAVNDATAEYQRNSDKVGNFMSECLEKSFDDNCKAGDVYNIYRKWCDLNGFGCENKANFFDELKTKNLYADFGTVDGVTCKRIIRGYKIFNDLNDKPPIPVPPPNRNKTEDLPINAPYPHY